MSRPPRAPGQTLLSWELMGRIVTLSSLLLAGAFGMFAWSLRDGVSPDEARTLVVSLFVAVQSTFLLNCRSLKKSIFEIHWFSNLWIWLGIGIMLVAQMAFVYAPTMHRLFHSQPLTLTQWGMIGAYAVGVMLLIELEKALWRWFKR